MISVQEFRNKIDETGDEFPLLTLEEFFDGNEDEYSIAPNEADDGRPELAEIYEKFKSLESNDSIAWIRVFLHDDTVMTETDDNEELLLCGDSIVICTCLSREEMEELADCEWLMSGGVSELDLSEYINCYPDIPSCYRCLTVEWD